MKKNTDMPKTINVNTDARNASLPPSLTPEAQAFGRKLIQRFFTLNGISIAFLMDNVLILYAIRNGVPDPVVAVIASFLYLTMPFMIFGKVSLAKIGAARSWSLSWTLRYLSAAIMILAPPVSQIAPQPVVTLVIVLGAFGFALFRSMGIVCAIPLEGDVTTPGIRGNFLAGNLLRANATQILSTIFLIGVIHFRDDLWVYQLLIAAACIIGIYASRMLAHIPESHVPKASARKPLSEAIAKIIASAKIKKLIYAWCAGSAAYMMVIPFQMIAVKSGYGVSDSTAISFSLLLMAGGIVSALVNRVIADKIGPKPILVTNTALLLICTGFWAAAPATFYSVPVGITFFIAGFCKIGILQGQSHSFLSSVKDTDRVGINMFVRIVSGAAAGIAGSVLGGGILSLVETVGVTGMDIHRFYFRFTLILLVGFVAVVSRLEDS